MSSKRERKYYLVAKYKDIDKPEIIELNQNWYLNNGIDIFSAQNDISEIDLITSKFDNIEQMKQRMYKNKYLKSLDVDLFIVHSKKFKNKNYIHETELLFKSKADRDTLVTSLAHKRLQKIDLSSKDKDDINQLLNRFLTKIYSRKSFHTFVTSSFTPVDKYFIEQILKNKTLNFSIKHKIKDKLTDPTSAYLFVRNIIATWNCYDKLKEKYEDMNEIDLGKKILSDYVEILNLRNNRRIYYPEIEKHLGKDYIEGQIDIESYLEEQKEKKEENTSKTYDYEKELLSLYEKDRMLKEQPFDDPLLQALYEKLQDTDKVLSKMTTADIQKLSPKDRLKFGMIDIVGYYNELDRIKRENNGKKRH